MSDPMNEVTWAKSLLGHMGYDVNRNSVTALVAWQYAEGGHHANDARFNPLNTTRDSKLNGGDYPYVNGHGVCSYPNRDVGLDKTVETLKLPAYADVRKDLERGAPPATTLGAVVASPWGTSSLATDAGVLARAKNAVADRPDVTSGRPDGGGRKGDAPAGSNKVVLDLHELRRLDRTYRTASDEIVRHRQVVGDIASALQPALAALHDRALATVIDATFDWLLAPGGGLDADARQHDRLSQLAGDIRRLAEEADADHDGRWSRGEAMSFASKHKGESGAALAAVTAALAGGTIVKRGANPGGGTANGGGTSGGGGSSRRERVEKMLDFAQKQKATDGGTNTTKYNDWYGVANGQPWCAMFVSYVFAKSGNPLPAMQTSHTGFAHCHYAIAYAREHGQLDSRPQVGDIFIRKDEQHTGIVSKVNADGSFETIEGNAGPNTDRVWHGKRENDGQYWFWTAIR
ncbi:CHAP domain-containing protein [Jatrophihabitans fulvus]